MYTVKSKGNMKGECEWIPPALAPGNQLHMLYPTYNDGYGVYGV